MQDAMKPIMQDAMKPIMHPPGTGASSLEVTLGADLTRLGLYRELTRHFLQGHVPWAGAIDDIVIVIDEALTNVVRHSCGEQPGAPITLRLVLEVLTEPVLAHLVITLMDCGTGGHLYRPEEKLLRARALAQAGETTGFGLILMDRLMDRIAYEAVAGRNMLVLEKWLGPDPFDVDSMLKMAREFSTEMAHGDPADLALSATKAPETLPNGPHRGVFELKKIIRRA